MAKDYAKSFYSSKRWQSCRNEYAKKKHHLCENCLRQGIFKAGEIVHHKIEITPITINQPEIALNHDNLELLCRECHTKVHGLEGGRWAKVNAKRKQEKINKKRYIVGENGEIISRESPLVEKK